MGGFEVLLMGLAKMLVLIRVVLDVAAFYTKVHYENTVQGKDLFQMAFWISAFAALQFNWFMM